MVWIVTAVFSGDGLQSYTLSYWQTVKYIQNQQKGKHTTHANKGTRKLEASRITYTKQTVTNKKQTIVSVNDRSKGVNTHEQALKQGKPVSKQTSNYTNKLTNYNHLSK